jgi:hypothetical protein
LVKAEPVRRAGSGTALFARTRRLESTDSVDKPVLLAAAATNRIKGLLFSQGASGYERLRRDR